MERGDEDEEEEEEVDALFANPPKELYIHLDDALNWYWEDESSSTEIKRHPTEVCCFYSSFNGFFFFFASSQFLTGAYFSEEVVSHVLGYSKAATCLGRSKRGGKSLFPLSIHFWIPFVIFFHYIFGIYIYVIHAPFK